MKFVDLDTQYRRIEKEINANIQKVLEHGQYVLGPEVFELERTLADYVGVKYAISCASGTDALLLALMSLNVGKGDKIITSPFTFIATAEVIRFLGATPVFIDIDPRTFNIDGRKIEEVIDPQVKGIIAVNLFGLPANYGRINNIANEHNLFVIEDAAQSFGAYKSCSLGDIACTSFFPSKPLGCYGDGGMCFTDDEKIADSIKSMRNHGDDCHIGMNSRLDTIQAAILQAKFKIFEYEITMRYKVACTYNRLLPPDTIEQPSMLGGSVWALYSVLAKDPDHRFKIINQLEKNNIPTRIYYQTPLHMCPQFKDCKRDLPVCEDIASRIFSLPMHPYLSASEQITIAEAIEEV